MPLKVLVVSSYGKSLINFRGTFLKALTSRGDSVTAIAPICEDNRELADLEEV